MKRIGMALALCLGAPQAAGAVTHAVSNAGLRSSPNNLIIEVGDPGWNFSTSLNGRITVVAQYGNESPIADFTSSCIDLSCNFTDQSGDPDGSIASRSWNFGDGGSSTSANPSHTYASAGTYDVTLSVTDDGGAGDSRVRAVVVSSAPAAFLINAAITDAWYDPLTAGQGFFIIVWDDIGTVFLSWFTYDTERPPQDVTAHLGEPGHRWLTAQGSYSGDTAALNVYETAGGVFDAPTPSPDPALLVGTISITWSGCNAGVLAYDLPSLSLSGDIPIERIVLDNVPACEAAQTTP
jgi:PKD repeat protein